MSAKAVVQGLEDSQLVRVFLDFIAAHRLHYDKNRKEISYKCFEATWILPNAKATGYGRTQTEAYKNALKNLLELLMEDPAYVEYFSMALLKPSAKGSKDPSPPPRQQLKTEGQQPEDKYKSQYDSFVNRASVSKGRQESQVSKISLNRSVSQKPDPEIEAAKNKIKTLEQRLSMVLDQNKVLRERIAGQQMNRLSSQIPVEQTTKTEIENSQKKLVAKGLSKVAIPRLNLQILPNYHKKSEKCLNDALMAAYEQKHRGERVC